MPTGRRNDGVPPDLRIEVSMNINETRGNDLSVSVDRAFAGFGNISDFGNAVALYRYVSAIRLTASTIDDCSILNDDIVGHMVLLVDSQRHAHLVLHQGRRWRSIHCA